MAAIVDGPSNVITCSRCSSARWHSCCSVVAQNERPVQVRAEEVHVPGGELVRPPPRVAGGGDRRPGVAVVGAVEAEHLAAAGVQPGHPDRVLVRVGAAVGEEHLLQAVRGQRRDPGGRLAPHVVGVLRRDRGQPGRLLPRSPRSPGGAGARCWCSPAGRRSPGTGCRRSPRSTSPRRRAIGSGCSAPCADQEWKTCARSMARTSAPRAGSGTGSVMTASRSAAGTPLDRRGGISTG